MFKPLEEDSFERFGLWWYAPQESKEEGQRNSFLCFFVFFLPNNNKKGFFKKLINSKIGMMQCVGKKHAREFFFQNNLNFGMGENNVSTFETTI